MATFTCTRCQQPTERATRRSRFCFDCSIKRMNMALSAGGKVAAEVRNGRLPKVASCLCVDCGKPARDYDHRDYMRPIDVVPVCRSCNLKRGPALDDKWRGPAIWPELSATDKQEA